MVGVDLELSNSSWKKVLKLNYLLFVEDYFILETNVYENQIQPTIQCLRSDSDNDVKSYFAEITEQEDLSNPNDSSEDNKLKDNDIIQIGQVTTYEQTNVES